MTDKIGVVCPSCNRSGKVLTAALGKLVACPACGHQYKLTNDQVRTVAEPDGYALEAAAPVKTASKPVPPPQKLPPDAPLPREPWQKKPKLGKLEETEGTTTRPKWLVMGAGGLAFVFMFTLVGTIVRLAFSGGTPSAVNKEWKTVEEPGGGFSISMPGKVERQIKTEKIPDGEVIHHVVMSETPPYAYVVDYGDFGFEIERKNLATFFDNFRDEQVRLRNGKVRKEIELPGLNNSGGRERIDEFPNPDATSKIKMLVARSRIYVDGSKFFEIIALAPKGTDGSLLIPDSGRFLDSFKRINPKIPEPVVTQAPKPPVEVPKPPPQTVAKLDPPKVDPPKREPDRPVEAAPKPPPQAVAKLDPPKPEPEKPAEETPKPPPDRVAEAEPAREDKKEPATPPPVAEADAASEELKYRWEQGKSYTYATKIAIDGGSGFQLVVEGQSVYKVLPNTGTEDFKLAYSATVEVRSQSVQNGQLKTTTNTQSINSTLKMDEKGEILELDGKLPILLVGDIASLIIEPFPDESQSNWDDEDFLVLTRVEGGGSNPVGFGRPSLRERSKAAAAARSSNNNRGTSRMKSRRAAAAAPPPKPPPTPQTVLTALAADRAEYRLGPVKSGLLPIHKLYVMLVEGTVNGKAPVELTGEGTMQFDRKAGVPRSVNYGMAITIRDTNKEIRLPISIVCKLLETSDLAKGTQKIGTPGAAPAPPKKPILNLDVDRLLGSLKKPGLVAAQACRELANATPLEKRRSDVARALERSLQGPDSASRGPAIGALSVWGDETTVPILFKGLGEDRFGSRDALIYTIGVLGQKHPAAVGGPLAVWLAKDAGIAHQIYRALGPSAEAELVKVVQGNGDPRGRIEACRLLGTIGTTACADALEELVKRKGDEKVGESARSAVRAITARRITDESLAEIFLDFKGDHGKRSRACQRLAAGSAIPGRKAEIARALEPLLDDYDNGVKVNAGHALGIWGDEQSAKIMAAHAKDSGCRDWRELVEDILKLSKPAALDVLIARIKDDRGHVSQIFEKLGPVAEDAALKALDSATDRSARTDICRMLKSVGTTKSVPVLEQIAQANEQFVSNVAKDTLTALKLRTISDAELSAAITVITTSTDGHRRREVLERVGACQLKPALAPKVIEALVAATRDPDQNTQRMAMKAIEPWLTPADAAVLVPLLQNKEAKCWREAARLLAKLDPSERTAEVVLTRFDDDGSLVQDVMRDLGPVAEGPLLKFMQHDGEERWRVEAGNLLQRQGTEASLPGLEALSNIVDAGKVGRAAEDALKSISQRISQGN